MEQVATLIHDPLGALPLEELWQDMSHRYLDFESEEFAARQDLLAWQFAGQLDACVAAFVALNTDAAVTPAMLRRAIERLLWVFPVYRTYGTGDAAPASDAAIRGAVRERVADSSRRARRMSSTRSSPGSPATGRAMRPTRSVASSSFPRRSPPNRSRTPPSTAPAACSRATTSASTRRSSASASTPSTR